MALSGIKVTPEQLTSLAGRVNGGAGNIDGELGGLKTALAPLGIDWAGAASGRFLALYEEWNTAARQLQQALLGISQLLGQAGESYAAAEQQIAASFGR